MASKSIQIRNVPEKVHAVYRLRAAKAGQSLSEYLLAELERGAKRLTNDELFEKLAALPKSNIDGVEAVRAGRAEREKDMDRWLSSMRRRSSKS
jgi:plasmid stability protein